MKHQLLWLILFAGCLGLIGRPIHALEYQVPQRVWATALAASITQLVALGLSLNIYQKIQNSPNDHEDANHYFIAAVIAFGFGAASSLTGTLLGCNPKKLENARGTTVLSGLASITGLVTNIIGYALAHSQKTIPDYKKEMARNSLIFSFFPSIFNLFHFVAAHTALRDWQAQQL